MTIYRQYAEEAVRNYVFSKIPEIFHAGWPDHKPNMFHTSKAVWRRVAKEHILKPFCVAIGFELVVSNDSWNVLFDETLNVLIEYLEQKAAQASSHAAIKSISVQLH